MSTAPEGILDPYGHFTSLVDIVRQTEAYLLSKHGCFSAYHEPGESDPHAKGPNGYALKAVWWSGHGDDRQYREFRLGATFYQQSAYRTTRTLKAPAEVFSPLEECPIEVMILSLGYLIPLMKKVADTADVYAKVMERGAIETIESLGGNYDG